MGQDRLGCPMVYDLLEVSVYLSLTALLEYIPACQGLFNWPEQTLWNLFHLYVCIWGKLLHLY